MEMTTVMERPCLRAWTLDPNPTTPWLCSLWATYYTSLGPSFLLCKIGMK